MRLASTENTAVVLDLCDRKSKHVCITKHTAPGHTVTLYTLVGIIKHFWLIPLLPHWTSHLCLCAFILSLSPSASAVLSHFCPLLPKQPLDSQTFFQMHCRYQSRYICRILLKPQNRRSFKTLLSFFPSSLQCTWTRLHTKHLEALFLSCILQKMITGRKHQAMA